MTHYSTFASQGDTWETMDLWQDTLTAIRDLQHCIVDVHTFLEHCLYAFLIIQAHAINQAEPMLLLTPIVLRSLEPLQPLLPQCQFLETARAVFRLYWTWYRDAEYGRGEHALEDVWQSLPWFGVSASLSGTQSPRSSFNHTLFKHVEQYYERAALHQRFRDTWLETSSTALCVPLRHHGELLLRERCSSLPISTAVSLHG